MQVSVIKPGLLTTLQDMGRLRYLSQAVPVSGAMDSLGARMANEVLGNNADAAILELTYADVILKAETDLMIAYSGQGALLRINDQPLPADRPVFIPVGHTLHFINTSSGCRTCLAIAGGWDAPELLGSRSTFLAAQLGGIEGRALKPGDVLKSRRQLSAITGNILHSLSGLAVNFPKWSIPREFFIPSGGNTIRVVPGNEFNWFNSDSINHFLSKPYTIGINSNRMSYQLEGEKMKRLNNSELLNTAVTPGTIQVTGSGEMILLMADCQTTGSYPRIAQVAAVDLPICAQLKPGGTINFIIISRQEAENLYLSEQQLQQLVTAVRYKYV